jgi:hypothetical protein
MDGVFQMKKQCIVAVFLALSLLEAVGYSIAFANRGAAANLRYWAYTDGKSEAREESLHLVFYPAYFIHTRVFGGDKQFTDREPFNPSPADHL